MAANFPEDPGDESGNVYSILNNNNMAGDLGDREESSDTLSENQNEGKNEGEDTDEIIDDVDDTDEATTTDDALDDADEEGEADDVTAKDGTANTEGGGDNGDGGDGGDGTENEVAGENAADANNRDGEADKGNNRDSTGSDITVPEPELPSQVGVGEPTNNTGEERRKSKSLEEWEELKNIPAIQSCIEVFDEEKVKEAIQIIEKEEGPLAASEKLGERLASIILDIEEKQPVTVSDKGHKVDGSHEIHIKPCQECEAAGKEPKIKFL